VVAARRIHGLHRNNQIYKMSVPSSGTGRNATKLTGKGGSDPIWSPDGKWIAFQRGNRVYVMTTNGKRLRRVATAGDGFFFSQLGWQPVP
jgi:Tol biopolymer transport system component